MGGLCERAPVRRRDIELVRTHTTTASKTLARFQRIQLNRAYATKHRNGGDAFPGSNESKRENAFVALDCSIDEQDGGNACIDVPVLSPNPGSSAYLT